MDFQMCHNLESFKGSIMHVNSFKCHCWTLVYFLYYLSDKIHYSLATEMGGLLGGLNMKSDTRFGSNNKKNQPQKHDKSFRTSRAN